MHIVTIDTNKYPTTKYCHVCKLYLPTSSFYKNKSKSDGLCIRCKDCQKEQMMVYRKSNSWKEYNNNYAIERRKNDPLFVEAGKIRSANRQLVKNIVNNTMYRYKNGNMTTTDLVGCEHAIFKRYIEQLFLDGMCWGNYGIWELDHIKPLISATDINQLYALNDYLNLQPLLKRNNREKYNN